MLILVKTTGTGVGWDLDLFSYSNKSLVIEPEFDSISVTHTSGMFMRDDGLKMYVVGKDWAFGVTKTQFQEYNLSGYLVVRRACNHDR